MKLISKRRAGLFVLGGTILAGLLSLELIRLRRGEELPLPNAYNDFVRAGEMVVGKTGDLDYKDAAKVAAFAVENSAVLIQVRNGLEKSCLVPVELKADWMARHVKEIMALRQAGNALDVLAKEREAAGAIDEAVNIRLDVMRMGIESRRGGALIDYLVGTGTELGAIESLARMIPRLNSTQARHALETLKGLPEAGASLSDAKRWERRWVWLGSGWWRTWEGIREMFDHLFEDTSDASPFSPTERQRDFFAARCKLVLALARREFELEQDRAPANDTELVPHYLLRLP